jgi:hypothetical protein
LLGKYEVSYFHCDQCGSLQTEKPYWLDEAYSDPLPDIGAVSRSQKRQVLTYFLGKVVGLSASDKILDWGGGDGLLVRMLRDVGLDSYLYDKYAENRFAVGFEDDGQQMYAMILAFEVWEHFAFPQEEVEKLFSRKPKFVFVSTGLYAKQGDNWPYLAPQRGRHLFFYSKRSRQYVADTFGYQVLTRNKLSVFYKGHLTSFRKKLLYLMLTSSGQKLLQIAFSVVPKTSLLTNDGNKLMLLEEDPGSIE